MVFGGVSPAPSRRARAAVVAGRRDVGGLDGGGRGRRTGEEGRGGHASLLAPSHHREAATRPFSTQTTTKTTMPTSGLPMVAGITPAGYPSREGEGLAGLVCPFL